MSLGQISVFHLQVETFAKLALMPEMGRPYLLTNPRLEGLRKWSVKGFEKHLIFYL